MFKEMNKKRFELNKETKITIELIKVPNLILMALNSIEDAVVK